MTHVIRCKLVCRSVQPVSNDPTNPMSRATFGAVWSEAPASENAVFGKYTPYAEFSANFAQRVAEKLEPGAEYYVDIQKSA